MSRAPTQRIPHEGTDRSAACAFLQLPETPARAQRRLADGGRPLLCRAPLRSGARRLPRLRPVLGVRCGDDRTVRNAFASRLREHLSQHRAKGDAL